MEGSPPATATDVEDVVWALQTAEALWKRNERGDAIVWLRRAAQAAGMTNDDDRALVLARGAAELTDLFARSSSVSLGSAPPGDGKPPSQGSDAAVEIEIDTLLRDSQVDPAGLAARVSPDSEALVSEAVPSFPVREHSVKVSVRPDMPLSSQPRPSVRVPTA